MSKRSYNQYCAVAYGLDRISERWTLLIVRELLLGQRRYKDILDALPGIGTNLLAERLKHMIEQEMVERRKLPPPAGSIVYSLTPLGRSLEPVIRSIAKWGRQFMENPGRRETFNPAWLFMAMQIRFSSEKARKVSYSLEYHIGNVIVFAAIREGKLETGYGPVPNPDVVIECDSSTFLEVVLRTISVAKAVKSGTMKITGDISVFEKSFAYFGL